MKLFFKLKAYRKSHFGDYYGKLADAVVSLLKREGADGLDILSQATESDNSEWRVPAIEAVRRDFTLTGSVLRDLSAHLRQTKPLLEKVLAKWYQIALQISTKSEELPTFAGLSYKGLPEVLWLSAYDSNLIFSAPQDFFTDEHICTFALESAAFFHYAYGMPLNNVDGAYFVEVNDQKVGVESGLVYLGGPSCLAVSPLTAGECLHLPRGRIIEVPSKDVIDAIRHWLVLYESEYSEFIMDALATLRLGSAEFVHTKLNIGIATLDRSIYKRQKVEALPRDLTKLKKKLPASRKTTYAQRMLDYEKVQAAMGDPAVVDRAKLSTALEVLVPKYLSLASFYKYIGYLTREDHAMFSELKYKKMVTGWTKYRERSLEAAAEKERKENVGLRG